MTRTEETRPNEGKKTRQSENRIHEMYNGLKKSDNKISSFVSQTI